MTDSGRSTWRADPLEVVRQCLVRALGAARWGTVRVGDDAVRVTEPRTALRARFTVRQTARRGPGGIWQVTGVRADRDLTLPPACHEVRVAVVTSAVLRDPDS